MVRGATYFFQGLLLTALYGFAHFVLVDVSTTHWYLPAGLRFAALLVLPARYWPFLYVAECGSMFAMKMPWVWQRGLPWVIVSTVTAMPPVAITIYAMKRWSKLPSIVKGRDILALIAGAAIIAVVTTAVNTACTYALMIGASAQPMLYIVGIWVLGQFLGILMFAPATILWSNRHRSVLVRRTLWRDGFIAASATGCAIAAFSYVTSEVHDSVLQCLRLAAGVSALALTYRHGWRGAALGVVLGNLAIGITAGPAYEPATLVAQEVVALLGTALLIAGGELTHHYEKAVRQESARNDTAKAARRIWADNEHENLEHANRARSAYNAIIRDSEEIIGDIRRAKRAEDIMRLTMDLQARTRSAASTLMQDIFPSVILSSEGLFGAIRLKRPQNGATYRTSFVGDSSILSAHGALSAYRVTIAAADHFIDLDASSVKVKVRVFKTSASPLIYVKVRADVDRCRSNADTANLARLHRRVSGLSGRIRVQKSQVAMLIPDFPVEADVGKPEHFYPRQRSASHAATTS